jgi:hypothetical protein
MEGFGFKVAGLAVSKKRSQLLSFISDFVEVAKSSNLVSRILDDAELTSRGFRQARLAYARRWRSA